MKLLAACILVVLIPSGRAFALAAAEAAEGPAYVIGPEDVLQVLVWNNEAMTRTVPVRPDGMISLPLLNDVPAAGLTPMQLRESLLKRLVEYIPTPEVSVIVTDVRSLKVSVVGEVTQPGRFELKAWATVMDVLAMAGAFREFAARSRIVVLRGSGEKKERIPFNYDKVIEGSQVNFYVRAGDIVMVP
jgi:polysaccharide export outer membrane protein